MGCLCISANAASQEQNLDEAYDLEAYKYPG